MFCMFLQLQKNLMTVAQFSTDNNLYFEFYALCCYVKDKETYKELFQGRLHKGFYVFESDVQSKQSFVSSVFPSFQSSVNNMTTPLFTISTVSLAS